MTTKEDIRQWLKMAKDKKATHMLVVCDTFEYEDYPVFVMEGEDVHEVIKEKCRNDNMQTLMEVYNLSKDLEKQLNEQRSFNY